MARSGFAIASRAIRSNRQPSARRSRLVCLRRERGTSSSERRPRSDGRPPGGRVSGWGGAGRSVIRLKGGDPFVFGRGGEEAEALADAGIPFEVVPGVTAGVAAPAYAGIPLTHRDDASAVAFVAGHEDPSKDGSAVDWDAVARFPGTLVLYMGVRRLSDNVARLVAAGRDAAEPAAAVERGTTP